MIHHNILETSRVSPTNDLSSPETPLNNTNRSFGHLEFNNQSNTSLLSTSSRRRARETEDNDAMLDGDFETSPRRARFDTDMLAREAFTPDPDGSAIYFYFPLNFAPSPDARTSNTIDTQDGELFPPSSGTDSPRRRSSRLMRIFGHRSPAEPPTPVGDDNGRNSESGGEAAGPSPQTAGQQLVLVRIRHLPDAAVSSTSPPTGQAEGGEINVPPTEPSGHLPGSPNNNPESAASSVFQWTIYFVMPRSEDPSVPPPVFNPNDAVQRAFSVLRAMMAGENMGYEEWVRLQEMLGTVSRGVSKDLVEQQCASHAFSAPSTIGISCPICLADYLVDERIRTLPCAHSYHAECIDTWLGSCNNCPLCRQQPVEPGPPESQ